MQLLVHGKQIDIGDALRAHVEETLPGAVGKYFENPTEATVAISKDGGNFRTDIQVHVGKGIEVHGHASSGDAYAAYDAAVEHVAKRLRRYKRRLRDHHQSAKEMERLKALQFVIAAEDDAAEEPAATGDEKPVIVAEMETQIETMSVSEAVMRMDLANLPAFMFRNRAHDGLNMVYRRPDGNIGWVDPRGARGGVPHKSS